MAASATAAGWARAGPKGGHALAILPGLTHYNIFASPLLAAAALVPRHASLLATTSEGDAMNFNNILIGSEDPKRLVDYYTKLFGKPAMEEGGYTGWQIGSGFVARRPARRGPRQEPAAGPAHLEHRERRTSRATSIG